MNGLKIVVRVNFQPLLILTIFPRSSPHSGDRFLEEGRAATSRIIDSTYNRYSFNDNSSSLPSWFVTDESKHNRPQMPVTKEMVQAIKAELSDLAAKPIKKVLEARGRKRKKAQVIVWIESGFYVCFSLMSAFFFFLFSFFCFLPCDLSWEKTYCEGESLCKILFHGRLVHLARFWPT